MERIFLERRRDFKENRFGFFCLNVVMKFLGRFGVVDVKKESM